MEISSPSINEKVCKISGKSNKYGGSDEAGKKCGEGHSGGTAPKTANSTLADFRQYVLDKEKGWPGSGKSDAASDDNAKEVSKNLLALNSDEKTIVAGLLAKTIEGGEVVEIRAVSSTSSMVNFGSIGRSGWVINQNLDYIIDEREQVSDSFQSSFLRSSSSKNMLRTPSTSSLRIRIPTTRSIARTSDSFNASSRLMKLLPRTL
ncbi:hypothetical protein ANAPRD1_01120 [Anaplasma phagocytophilum]|nr:hypothetical protein [Anaplasma phagocytophilum]SCV66532.1 hypothetical protein ANAPRD1_01120 [Anaplasma phagocytophilum]